MEGKLDRKIRRLVHLQYGSVQGVRRGMDCWSPELQLLHSFLFTPTVHQDYSRHGFYTRLHRAHRPLCTHTLPLGF